MFPFSEFSADGSLISEYAELYCRAICIARLFSTVVTENNTTTCFFNTLFAV